MTTVLHMTDLHVGNPGETAYSVNTRANFEALAEAARREHADYLVLTGDLVLDENDPSLYDYVRSHLPNVPGNILVTPGNHENAPALRETFPEQFSSTQVMYTALPINNEQVILLDSSSGRIDEKQLAFLEETIRAGNASSDGRNSNRLIIFMHHPPVFAGVRHMDEKYALANMGELQNMLKGFPGPVYIFCGHYHVEKTIAHHTMTVWITPCNLFQIDHFAADFTPDHYRIGYRLITFDEHAVRTWVRYIDAPGKPKN